MDSLPNELLMQIASHLDTEPPSVVKISHEPSSDLTHSDATPLKDLSRVSWRLRKVVLSILFRYVRIPLDTRPQWVSNALNLYVLKQLAPKISCASCTFTLAILTLHHNLQVPIDARLLDNMQSQLTKLSNHEFMVYQRMKNKIKGSSGFAYDEAFDDLLINLCRIEDSDSFLMSVPNLLWFPHLPKRGLADLSRFVGEHSLQHHIRSVVVHTEKEYELRHVMTADHHLAAAVAEIWSQIFSHFDPTRVVVAAPPTTMAGLLDAQLLSSDVWAFDMNMHYVELVQKSVSAIDHMETTCGRPWGTALIHRRPWTHLGYNEGSSITAYSTYEYHLKQSPKMLYLTLIRLAKEARPCCNIRSFSFVGVFPFSTNVAAVIRALQKIRTLEEVRFQISPGPENNVLSSQKRMGRAQAPDLWLEWNGSE
jgi:hypothetical protein